MTFAEFYEVYETDVRPRLRGHTWRNKDYLVKSKIMPFFKNYRMSEIQGIDITRWQNGLMDGGNNNGQSYAPTYLRTVNNQLSAVLNHAAHYYGLHPNPVGRTMKMGGKETPEMRF
nr:N-terminal phage integrase SAM-like domain-containing protein [Collinsella sp. zg1085]